MNEPAQRRAADILQRAWLRVTAPRLAVLTVLIQHGGHISAEEALERAQAKQPSMTRSTVYRALERFRDLRLISETDLGDGVRRFEIVETTPHHHLVCVSCGSIIEFEDHQLDRLRAGIDRDYGFRAEIDHLAVFGRCRACRPAV